MFPGLQSGYPWLRTPTTKEQSYIVRDAITAKDVAFNVRRRRRERKVRPGRADALEACGRSRCAARRRQECDGVRPGDAGCISLTLQPKNAASLPDCCHRNRGLSSPGLVRRVELESCEYPRTSSSSLPHSSPWHRPLRRRNAFHRQAPSGLHIQDPTRRGGCDCQVTRERSVGLPGVQRASRCRLSDGLQILSAERFTERLTVELYGRPYLRAVR
jgi:hypothetical protein